MFFAPEFKSVIRKMRDLVSISAFTILLLCGCAEKQQSAFVHSVVLTQPAQRGLENEKSFSGVVEEAHEISLGFKTPGQIKRILVKEGDHVRQGQLIATLDDVDYQLGVDQLQIQYDQLDDEMKRLEKLHQNHSLSDNDYVKAVAGLKQVGVQLQTYRNKLEYTQLKAPVSGYVQSVNFEPAEMVDAGTPIINLLDVHRMEVSVNLPANLYMIKDRIKQIVCRSPFEPGKEIPMKLISIVPKADGVQLYKMRLTFENEGDIRLTAGQNIEVNLRIAGTDSQNEVTLTPHAIFQEQGTAYVWVLGDDSVVHKQAVTVAGLDEKGDAIISSGLTGNERVVRAGVNALQDNEQVRVVEEHVKTNIGGLL